MAKKLYEESSIQGIANAIRAKNGSSDTYTVGDMATAIQNIPTGGGDITGELIISNDDTNLYDINLEIVIPEGITTLTAKSGASEYTTSIFSGMKCLHKVVLPNSLVTLPSSAFYRCYNLESINLQYVTTVLSNAFKECPNLKNVIFSNQLSIIDDSCFSQCSKLDNIIIPSRVGMIKNNAFAQCTSLKNIIFPEYVYDSSQFVSNYFDGQNNFYACTALEEIVLPKNVIKLGRYTFRGCTSLKSITLPASNKVTIYSSSNDPLINVPADCSIYVPESLVNTYKQDTYWSARADYIQAIPS